MKNQIIDVTPIYDKTPLSDWTAVVTEESNRNVSLRGPVLMGMATLILGLGGFLGWAATTTLAQASIASGIVIVESKTKTVTHLEGGTLVELLVKEGDHVAEQQVLAKLDITRSQALLRRLEEELFATSVRLARLTAERDGKSDFAIPMPEYEGLSPQFMARVIADERGFMQRRAKLLADQLGIDASLIEQVNRQSEALALRLASFQEQLKTARNDYETLKGLSSNGLATRSQLSDAKYTLSNIESQIQELQSQLDEGRARKNQFELNRASRQSENLRTITGEIQEAQVNISKLTQDAVAARDVVEKSVIRSPQDGIVSNIRLRTPGSALIPGQPLLDIVPDNQPMLIEGRARASDIDTLQVGQKAEIRLSAFSATDAEPLIGEIIYLAPDSQINEQSGEISYAFKARIPDEELKKQPNLFLHAGMGAEVFVVKGNRTALSYLLLPVKHSFGKAFRED
jgi:HlyD family secretion protein